MITFKTTEDGSTTLYNSTIGEHYHSIHGARNESEHIFLHSALHECPLTELTILEIGLGTGLNALLTALDAEKNLRTIHYHTLELYPLNTGIILSLMPTVPKAEQTLFTKIHQCTWEEEIQITDHFSIHKHQANLLSAKLEHIQADVVYFDAFSPEKQPELWTADIFQKIYNSMRINSVLTTYCAKGIVRRAMQSVGFTVERIAGPTGKRHITRATKLI